MRSHFGLCVVFFSACFLFVSMFVPISLSSQPPIDTTKFYEGTSGWGPYDADPGVAYDEASQELIFNSYQNLIAYSGEQYYSFVPQLATNVPTLTNVTMIVTNASAVVVGGDPTDTAWTDGSTTYAVTSWTDEFGDGFHQGDVIVLTDGTSWHAWTVDGLSGASTITLNLWHGSYIFNIDTTHDIFFYDNNGNHVGKFNVTDAAYSLQRYLVMDPPRGPIWMCDKPLFDLTDHMGFDNSTAMNLAHMIANAIVPDLVANTLTINVGCHFPDNAFKQILSNTWGCIGSKNNTITIGGWNGNLTDTSKYGGPFPDWWLDWAGQGSGIDYATLDPSNQLVPSAYCGTGPYHIASIDKANNKVVMQKNPDFWMGWPAPGCNSSIDTVEIDYIAQFDLRKAAFLAGGIDTCVVPSAFFFEFLDNTTKQPVDPKIKTIKNLVPAVSMDAYYFTFTIANTSAYIGTGSFPNGIPTDFFNNTHVRKAFAYSIDQPRSISYVWLDGEATREFTPLREGLYPDYRTVTSGYDINYSAAEAELKRALFNGTSVWDTGFTLTVTYPLGSLSRIYATMAYSFFDTLSTFDGRAGPAFTINLAEIAWATYWNQLQNQKLPIWYIDSASARNWLGEFADADNMMRPYLHSDGAFAQFQNYTLANGWGSTHGVNHPTLSKDQLIDLALLTQDGPERAKMYADLENIYMNDCPSLPLPTPTGRIWCQYWVKGWYYNALYPSIYFRNIWKQDTPWYDISGTVVGTSDNVVAMKDIAYLIAHFNAKAPVPGLPTDPKWVGVYGANGAVDPFGDRVSNMKDIAGAISRFNVHGPGNP